MKHRKKFPAILAIALLTCALAPSAWALIPCELCESDDGDLRCAGVCNGVLVSFCSDWFFLGCGSFHAVAPEETVSEADFIRALNLQADWTAPADAGPAPLLAEVPSAPSCGAPAP